MVKLLSVQYRYNNIGFVPKYVIFAVRYIAKSIRLDIKFTSHA